MADAPLAASSVRIELDDEPTFGVDEPGPPSEPGSARKVVTLAVAFSVAIGAGALALGSVSSSAVPDESVPTTTREAAPAEQPLTFVAPNSAFLGVDISSEQIAGRLLTSDSQHFAWTNNGDVARSLDGVNWVRDELLSNPNVRAFGLFEHEGELLMVGTWEFQQDDLVVGTFRLDTSRLAPDGSQIESSGFKIDRDRPLLTLGPRSTTQILFTQATDTTVVIANTGDVPTVHLSSPETTHMIVLRRNNRPRGIRPLEDSVLILVQDGAIEIDPRTGSVSVVMSLSFSGETRPS